MAPSRRVLSANGGDGDTPHRLSSIWRSLLGVESIRISDNYFDLGGDSSLAVEMFAQIEKNFGVRLPLATLYEAATIEELAKILDGTGHCSGWSPLVAVQPSGSLPPLFCFHGAGGNVLMYRQLSRYLGTDQPLYGLQSLGMDGTSPPLTTIEEMSALYAAHIRRVQPRGPYLLGGYCMGGTLAYEVAQRLEALGEKVALLALFDTMNWREVPLTFWNKILYNIQKIAFHAASVLELDSVNRRRFLREKVDVLQRRIPVWLGLMAVNCGWRKSRGTASDSLALGQVWQTNDRACWNYVAKPYPGTIVDFRPSRQYRVFNKPGLKWDQLAQGGERAVILPVYPAGMLVEPFVERLAAALRAEIDRATASSRFAQPHKEGART